MDRLKDIVLNNDKHRFEFSDDMDYIRACQGHSIEVDVELLVSPQPLLLNCLFVVSCPINAFLQYRECLLEQG